MTMYLGGRWRRPANRLKGFLGLLTFLAVLVCFASCKREGRPSRAEDMTLSDDESHFSEEELDRWCRELRKFNKRGGDCPYEEFEAELIRLGKTLPEDVRLKLLASIATSPRKERFIAGASGSLIDRKAFSRVLLRVLERGQSPVDPAVVGWVVFNGSDSGSEALNLGFKLLDDVDAWRQLAGHVTLTLSTLQALRPDFRAIDIRRDPPRLDRAQWDGYRGNSWSVRRVLQRALEARARRKMECSRTGRPLTALESEMGGRMLSWLSIISGLDSRVVARLKLEEVPDFVETMPKIRDEWAFGQLRSELRIAQLLP